MGCASRPTLHRCERDESQQFRASRDAGEYWGEMGYVRVAKGNNALLLESECAWAVPKDFTTANTPCYEDGTNCLAKD